MSSVFAHEGKNYWQTLFAEAEGDNLKVTGQYDPHEFRCQRWRRRGQWSMRKPANPGSGDAGTRQGRASW